MKSKIIVHGGLRNREADEADRKKDVIAACEEAYELLKKQSAVDAVELAIQRLDASKHLNDGVGSYLQLDGHVRMDALIMTNDLAVGAVIGIEDVAHPRSDAGRVMETTQQVALAGPLVRDILSSDR